MNELKSILLDKLKQKKSKLATINENHAWFYYL